VGGEPGSGSLFREEALEFLARQRGPGEVLRVSATWTGWAFWALLGLIVVGLVVMLLVHVSGEPLLYVFVPALRTLMERVRAS